MTSLRDVPTNDSLAPPSPTRAYLSKSKSGGHSYTPRKKPEKKPTLLVLLGIVEDDLQEPTRESIQQSERFKQLNKIPSFILPEDDEDKTCLKHFTAACYAALNFPAFVFGILYQSVITWKPVTPADYEDRLTVFSKKVGYGIYFVMILLYFTYVSYAPNNSELLTICILTPIAFVHTATVIYVWLRHELSRRLPVRRKKTQTLCCGLIEIYSSIDWTSIFNYWEPLVPIVEYYQLSAGVFDKDMNSYWGIEESGMNYPINISTEVWTATILWIVTLIYFVGVGCFLHFDIDPGTNMGYLVFEFIPGSLFLTISAYAMQSIISHDIFAVFSGCVALCLYSSTSIFVTIYRYHEKWFADIYYIPIFLAIERILKEIYSFNNVLSFGFVEEKFIGNIVIILTLFLIFCYLRPCSKGWLIFIRSVFMLAALGNNISALICIRHGKKSGHTSIAVWHIICFLLFTIHLGFRIYFRFVDKVYLRRYEHSLQSFYGEDDITRGSIESNKDAVQIRNDMTSLEHKYVTARAAQGLGAYKPSEQDFKSKDLLDIALHTRVKQKYGDPKKITFRKPKALPDANRDGRSGSLPTMSSPAKPVLPVRPKTYHADEYSEETEEDRPPLPPRTDGARKLSSPQPETQRVSQNFALPPVQKLNRSANSTGPPLPPRPGQTPPLPPRPEREEKRI